MTVEWKNLPVRERKIRLLNAIEWVKARLKSGKDDYICYSLEEYDDSQAAAALTSIVQRALDPFYSFGGWMVHAGHVLDGLEGELPYRLAWLDKISKAIKEFKQ